MPQFLKVLATISLLAAAVDAQSSRCSKEPDGAHLPVPNSRTTYIQCTGGVEHVRTCPAGHEFNPFDLVCRSASDSSHRAMPNFRPASPRDRCFNQADNTYLADPTSRSRFIMCVNGEALIGDCPTNEVFNEQSSRCEARTPVARPPGRPAPPPRAPPTRAAPAFVARPTRPPLNQQPGARFNQPPPSRPAFGAGQRPVAF